MSKKLYIECNTGISGDMIVASLLDLGADREKLEAVLSSLKSKVGGFETKISPVVKAGIVACDFDVILEQDNHDHDMNYLYGHDSPSTGYHDHEHHHGHHEHHHDHHRGHEHDHHHDHQGFEYDHYHDHEHHHDHHDHDHEHESGHHHPHVHRSLSDVVSIIDCADMTESARALARKVFTVVAEAEAAVHGRSIEEVHFHEVGAIDSIVDIISAAVCFDDIIKKYAVSDTVITKLVDGTGTVRCQHGILSVPVPAVLKIAEQHGVPVSITNRRGEFVTPTGAAFAAAVMTSDALPERFRIVASGIGAGKREYEIPGMVRSMIIES